jgi:hypothetical protein
MGESPSEVDWNVIRKTAGDCLNAVWSLVCFAESSLDSDYDLARAEAHLALIDEARSKFREAMEVLQPGFEMAADDGLRHSPVFDALALATASHGQRPEFRYGPVSCATAHSTAFELLRHVILWCEDALYEIDDEELPADIALSLDCLHEVSLDAIRDAFVRLQRRNPLQKLVNSKGARQIRSWIDVEWAAVTRTPTAASRPSWDRATGKLSFKGQVVRAIRSKKVAANVVLILDSFEELHWPTRIDSPLRVSDSTKHHATIRSLNDGLVRIRFRSDGDGLGFVWEEPGGDTED